MKTYVLKNKLTGQFFNGTNFGASRLCDAKHFTIQPDMRFVRECWGDGKTTNAQVFEVMPGGNLEFRTND